jgi:branched-chain amino acid transport system ATP-binding protein
LSTAERVRHGLALSPEGRQTFPIFTVEENLLMGGYHRADRNWLHGEIARVCDRFPRLAERRRQRAGSVSGGEQQMLAIGRALIARPRSLLLDEPTLGLAPILVEEIGGIVRRLAADGMTEQNAAMALSVGDRAYVLESGRIPLTGAAASLREGEDVRRLYLGRRACGAGLTPPAPSCMPDISRSLIGRCRIVPPARSEADHDSRAGVGD